MLAVIDVQNCFLPGGTLPVPDGDKVIPIINRLALASDFCVAWSALDARRAGFNAVVIEDGTRGIDAGGSLVKAWADMTGAGVGRITSSDLSHQASTGRV